MSEKNGIDTYKKLKKKKKKKTKTKTVGKERAFCVILNAQVDISKALLQVQYIPLCGFKHLSDESTQKVSTSTWREK